MPVMRWRTPQITRAPPIDRRRKLMQIQ